MEQDLKEHLDCYTDQVFLKEWLITNNLLTFIPNGAILPRQSGTSQQAIKREKAVPFTSPPNLITTVSLPSGKQLTGCGLPLGIHLLVGGGYHGKSTLLEAIEYGIYPHIQGDGREFVCTHPSAVKIKAENGRNINSVNLTPFINHLPTANAHNTHITTENFSTPNASGSTSQAASILEAVSAKSKLLLMDEDSCATNLMFKDPIMEQLIDNDPITTFLTRVQELFNNHGVSTIIVVGSIGEYFQVASKIFEIKNFQMLDITQKAQALNTQKVTEVTPISNTVWQQNRHLLPSLQNFIGKTSHQKIKSKAKNKMLKILDRELDFHHFEHFICPEQIATLGNYLIHFLKKTHSLPLTQILDEVNNSVSEGRFTGLPIEAKLTEIRGIDLMMVINRINGLLIGNDKN